MSLTINSNPTATANNQRIGLNNASLNSHIGNLASGKKLDALLTDSGGLANSIKLESAIKRTDAVRSNVSNSISLLQSQDAGLSQASEILNRISEIKTLSDNPLLSDADKSGYEAEFGQLQEQLSSISQSKFNGVALFGNEEQEVATSEDGKTSVTLNAADIESTNNGLGDVLNAVGLNDVADLKSINDALNNVASLRAQNGATANALENSIDKLNTNQVNLEEANSRIIDTDYVSEVSKLAQDSIKQQFGIAVAAQANSHNQNAVALLV